MFSSNDFNFLREYPKLCKKWVETYNSYADSLISQINSIELQDVEPYSGTLQQSLDAFIERVEVLCEGTDFEFIDSSSTWNSGIDIDDGFRKYKIWSKDDYYRKHNSFCDLFFGKITNLSANLTFYISVDAKINEENQFVCILSVFLINFNNERIEVELSKAQKFIPLMEFLIKKDYSDFIKKIEELNMEVLTTKQCIQMNETVLEVYIKNLCQKFNLQYSIKKENRGQVVKIKLPKKLCFRFRIHPDHFNEQKKSIEPLLQKAMEFIQEDNILGSIQFYSPSDSWQS